MTEQPIRHTARITFVDDDLGHMDIIVLHADLIQTNGSNDILNKQYIPPTLTMMLRIASDHPIVTTSTLEYKISAVGLTYNTGEGTVERHVIRPQRQECHTKDDVAMLIFIQELTSG